MTTDELVGDRVHQEMWRRRITQTAMAPLMGVSQATISSKVRGKSPWTVDDLLRVSAILGVEPAELLPAAAADAAQLVPDPPMALAVTVGKGTTKGSCSTSAGRDALRPLSTIALANGCDHSAEWLRAS